jgi:hypothetical protein
MANFNFKSFIISTLRRASYKWKPRSEALNKVKQGRNQYKCEGCGEIFGRKDIQIDHRSPVVDPTIGFVDWNTFIERLFVEVDGYQALCKKTCHYNKTQKERELRKKKS